MPEQEKLKELASLVLEWNEFDKRISQYGWDGGKMEQGWENAKRSMVIMAAEVLGRKMDP